MTSNENHKKHIRTVLIHTFQSGTERYSGGFIQEAIEEVILDFIQNEIYMTNGKYPTENLKDEISNYLNKRMK